MATTETITHSPVQDNVFMSLHLTKGEARVLREMLCSCISWNSSAAGEIAENIHNAIIEAFPYHRHHSLMNLVYEDNYFIDTRNTSREELES